MFRKKKVNSTKEDRLKWPKFTTLLIKEKKKNGTVEVFDK